MINKCIKRYMSLAINIRGLANLSHTFCILVVIGAATDMKLCNHVTRVSPLCFPWSLEERPWLQLVTRPPRIWVLKKICWVGGVAECFVCCYDKPCAFKTLIRS